MSICVYVGNLATSTTEAMIRTAFTEAGCSVGSVTILRSAQKDRSRGFGFVEVGTTEAVAEAIQRMNGCTVDGRVLSVSEARLRPPARGDRRSFQSYSGAGEGGGGGPRRKTGARRKAR